MDLVIECYNWCNACAEEQYGLASQIRRAAVSIPANIAEGFGRWHSKEFVHFLLIANGSLKSSRPTSHWQAPWLFQPADLAKRKVGRRNRPHAGAFERN